MYTKMIIVRKNWLQQLLCKHSYAMGVITNEEDTSPKFTNISGTAYVILCTKCGKRNGTCFIRNADGS